MKNILIFIIAIIISINIYIKLQKNYHDRLEVCRLNCMVKYQKYIDCSELDCENNCLE